MSGRPSLSLVVSTVGRPGPFGRLLDSLDRVPGVEDVQLVLVDQSADQSCARLLESRGTRARSVVTTSGRGASRGRNVGIQLAQASVLGFPDDNAWFPPETLPAVLATFAERPLLAGLSARQATPQGADSMLRWRRHPSPVTEANFLHTSIMSGMFFTRRALDQVGHFDESMGVGSEGWYGAGEESDLLLRVLRSGGQVHYDPALTVLQEETRDDADAAFAAKMLRYGAGMGHLWRLHSLSRPRLAWYATRKVVGVAVRTGCRQTGLAEADRAYLRGLVAGYRDRRPEELRAD